MSTLTIDEMNCPLQITMAVLEGKYKIYIIYHLMKGTLRYNELSKLIPDATPKMLSQQLKALEEQGVILRKLYPVVPPKTEYSLTERGQSLAPIILSMYKWGDEVFREHGKENYCSYEELQKIVAETENNINNA